MQLQASASLSMMHDQGGALPRWRQACVKRDASRGPPCKERGGGGGWGGVHALVFVWGRAGVAGVQWRLQVGAGEADHAACWCCSLGLWRGVCGRGECVLPRVPVAVRAWVLQGDAAAPWLRECEHVHVRWWVSARGVLRFWCTAWIGFWLAVVLANVQSCAQRGSLFGFGWSMDLAADSPCSHWHACSRAVVPTRALLPW